MRFCESFGGIGGELVGGLVFLVFILFAFGKEEEDGAGGSSGYASESKVDGGIWILVGTVEVGAVVFPDVLFAYDASRGGGGGGGVGGFLDGAGGAFCGVSGVVGVVLAGGWGCTLSGCGHGERSRASGLDRSRVWRN